MMDNDENIELEEIKEEIIPAEIQIKNSLTLDDFSPINVPFQHRVVYDVKKKFDYSKGAHTVLLSGAYGSGKSVLAAHLIILHCLENSGAVVGIGRISFRSVRESILREVLDHIPKNFVEGIHYTFNRSFGQIKFFNGSTVTCYFWSDKRWTRFRGLYFSMFVIDEASENETNNIYMAVLSRIRMKSVKEKLFILITNPDEPEHWINTDIILKAGYVNAQKTNYEDRQELFHIYKSITSQNKNLPDDYYPNLLKTMSAREVERYLNGEWISMKGTGAYSSYSHENLLPNNRDVNLNYPLIIACDFNMTDKPMSWCLMQYIEHEDTFVAIDEMVAQNTNTEQGLAEIERRGWLSYDTTYKIIGDVNGWASTRGGILGSDYAIMDDFFKRYKQQKRDIQVRIDTPRSSNPSVEQRVNLTNAYCKNAHGQIRILVSQRCTVLNKGFKLTKWKKDIQVLDDRNTWQHIVEAFSYAIYYYHRDVNRKLLKGRGNIVE
jgi:PBSX family phage terminase large subunit